MKIKVYLVWFLLIVALGCNEAPKEKFEDKLIPKVDSATSFKTPKTKDADTLLDKGKYKNGFKFVNGSITQSLLITVNGKSMMFKAQSTDSTGRFILEGKAKLLNQGQETISDDEGNGYFVSEYIYKLDGCDIIFRIDEDFKAASMLYRGCKTEKFTQLKHEITMLSF